MGWPQTKEVARSTPFDNSTNGFVSTNVQEAIEEVQADLEARLAYSVSCGFNGTATSGRWLEFISSVGSNEAGYVIPQDGELISLSISTRTNSTGTATVYKNGSSVTTISLSSADTNFVSGLTFAAVAGDEYSAQVTSGSFDKPVVFIHLKVVT